MSDFTEKIHLRGKAEENIYFSKLDRKLIEALRQSRAKKAIKETQPVTDPSLLSKKLD